MKNKIEKIHITINNKCTCYVPYSDYKKMKQSYEDRLKNVTVKKEYKIGDEVKYCDMDWYVIDLDDKNKLVKLMLKEAINPMTYSDDNSNDWIYSNVRKYLNKEFINKLDEDKLQLMNINYDEGLIAHDYIAIPTLRDIEKLPMNIRNCDKSYWTMTSSYGVSEDCSSAFVFNADSGGALDLWLVDNTYGVRPVITLSADELE